MLEIALIYNLLVFENKCHSITLDFFEDDIRRRPTKNSGVIMTDDMKVKIKDIPSDGYWKPKTLETFINSGQLMLDVGMGEKNILDILANIYSVLLTEFGAG